jgi:hypothetical protein
LMPRPNRETIRAAIEEAESAVMASSRLRRGPERASHPERIRVLEESLVGVCAILWEIVDYIDEMAAPN